MAAALSAYDDHEDQFDRIAQKVPPRVDTGEVTARVVAGEESVETVLADLGEDDGDGDSGGEAEENDDHQPRKLTEEEQTIKELRKQVERLQNHAGSLEDTIAEKDEQLAEKEEELTGAQ